MNESTQLTPVAATAVDAARDLAMALTELIGSAADVSRVPPIVMALALVNLASAQVCIAAPDPAGRREFATVFSVMIGAD